MFITLRALHIVLGVFWAGAIFFTISYLVPAVRDLGPDGGKVINALMKRGYFTALPVIALLNLISGFWLYYLSSGGNADWFRSRPAMYFGIGGVAALAAFLVGVFLARPTMVQMNAVGAALATATGADRDAKMAEMDRLRAKNLVGLRITATLLGVTVITMALARYM